MMLEGLRTNYKSKTMFLCVPHEPGLYSGRAAIEVRFGHVLPQVSVTAVSSSTAATIAQRQIYLRLCPALAPASYSLVLTFSA